MFRSDSIESWFWNNEIKMVCANKVSICIQIKGKIYCKKIRDTRVGPKGVEIDMLIDVGILFDRLLKESLNGSIFW